MSDESKKMQGIPKGVSGIFLKIRQKAAADMRAGNGSSVLAVCIGSRREAAHIVQIKK